MFQESPVSDRLRDCKVYAQVSIQTPLQKRLWHIVGIPLGWFSQRCIFVCPPLLSLLVRWNKCNLLHTKAAPSDLSTPWLSTIGVIAVCSLSPVVLAHLGQLFFTDRSVWIPPPLCLLPNWSLGLHFLAKEGLTRRPSDPTQSPRTLTTPLLHWSKVAGRRNERCFPPCSSSC